MKEFFVETKFKPESRAMIATVNDILESYREQGYDLSLRQLYYQLVSKNIVPNTERSYKNVGNLVSDARLAGLIDWDMIKDRGREMTKNPHWTNPKFFLTTVAPQFRINLWEGQENYVEVMVEKQALEGVLEPVCRSLDIPFTANKGYSSSSAMYEAGKRMAEKAEEGMNIYIIYLGDHDPSGIDMSRDVLDRLKQFSGNEDLDVHRVALNMNQIEDLNPPENPAKITDSRADSYIARFGRSSWELDAIEPRQLDAIVRTAVARLIDEDKFNERKKLMEDGRKLLVEAANKFK